MEFSKEVLLTLEMKTIAEDGMVNFANFFPFAGFDGKEPLN